MSAGKGDTPRPVNKARYDANYDSIQWKRKRAADKAPAPPRSDKTPSGKA